MTPKKTKYLEVNLSSNVIKIFENLKQQNKKSHESGGILLGQITGNKVYILKASTPNKFDKSSRYSFECNKDSAQVIIDYEFNNSNQKTIYLGEWHTHPETIPSPSFIDKDMIRNQYFKNKLNEPFLILIIQGLKELFVASYDGISIERINYKITDH
jgi:integrative and conjugative element protein (TIGR02256 family)